MQVTTDYEALEWLLGEVLLPRWRSTPKGYPFNRPDAIIPQTMVPDWLRKDVQLLSNWYTWVDEHMKGRVDSLEAFRGHLRIVAKYPWFYHAREVIYRRPAELIAVLEDCISTDKVNVARDIKVNAVHLHTYWDGWASNMLRGIHSYDEALRRILNKKTKTQRARAGWGGEGLYGHQEKMVSMLLYFWDWEELLSPRFPYPSPSDIQNVRVGIAAKALVVDGLSGDSTRNRELLAAAWRDVVLRYIVEHKADPREVSDVLWLFGKHMCGRSPLAETSKRPGTPDSGMFAAEEIPYFDGVAKFLHPDYRDTLEATCLVCPFRERCDVVVPARPYYDKGLIELRPRPRVERHIVYHKPKEPTFQTPENHLPLPFGDPSAA